MRSEMQESYEERMDRIEKMTIQELEVIIQEYWEEGLWNDLWEEFDELLEGRCHKLRELCEENKNHLPDIDRVNSELTKVCEKVVRDAKDLFEKLKKDPALDGYNRIEITAIVAPDDEGDISDDSGSNYKAMSEILAGYAHDNPALRCFEYSITYSKMNGIENSGAVGVLDDGRLEQDWTYLTFCKLHGEVGDFPVSRPMKSLYLHSPYSIQDIIRLKSFKPEITVKFES